MVKSRNFEYIEAAVLAQERSEIEELKALQTWLRDKVPANAGANDNFAEIERLKIPINFSEIEHLKIPILDGFDLNSPQ